MIKAASVIGGDTLLAYHYAQASDFEKAQEYLFRAGDQAIKMAADDEAFAHFKKAISAYEQMFGQDWDKVQRAGRAAGDSQVFAWGLHGQAFNLLKLGDLAPFPHSS